MSPRQWKGWEVVFQSTLDSFLFVYTRTLCLLSLEGVFAIHASPRTALFLIVSASPCPELSWAPAVTDTHPQRNSDSMLEVGASQAEIEKAQSLLRGLCLPTLF